MKGLFQRGGVWWFRWTPAPGLPQERRSTGETDEVLAIARAREIRAKVTGEAIEKATACDAEITAYLDYLEHTKGLAKGTSAHRSYILTSVVRALGSESPRSITVAAVKTWFAAARKAYEPTAVAYITVLSWWLQWLVDRGKLPTNPVKQIELPKKTMQPRKRILRPEEARQMLDECHSPRLKFALYCALQAGLRKMEVIEAIPAWFDLNAGLLHIDKTPTFAPKDRDARTIPLTEEFSTWLKTFYGLKKPFMLAPRAKHGRARYRYDFRKEFDTHKAAVGLPDITFHDLRRTFASLLVSKGISIYKVAKWLGDEVEVVQNTYGHLIPQDDEINAAWK